MTDLAILQAGPGRWIIHDPALQGQIEPDWFDPARWQGRMVPLTGAGRVPPRKLETPLGTAVWRHYYRGGVPGRFIRDRFLWCGLSSSRPYRELAVLQLLHSRGVPVPRPLAAQVWRRGLSYQGDLMTAWLPASRTLAEHLAAGAEVDWAAIGQAIARMHAAGCNHADLNAHNLLLDADGRIWLIDFDRARLGGGSMRWIAGNLRRLQRSLRKLDLMPDAARWRQLLDAHRQAMHDAG